MQERAPLEVVCGPMFSGKTDRLIARFDRAYAAGVSALAFKPIRDGRHSSDRIVSHSGLEIPAVAVGSVEEVAERGRSHELVLLDEIQFFEPELAATVDTMRGDGIEIVAVGLDRDFRGIEFETTAALALAASRVVRLTGACSRCGEEAVLTQRLIDGVPAPLDSPRLVVGDAELYEPRCERCWEEERAALSGAGARVREP
jgi:thymidine kinase